MISLRITFALVLDVDDFHGGILIWKIAEPDGQRGVVSSIAGSTFLGKTRTLGRCRVAHGTFRSLAPLPCMKIRSHSESHLVELDDGSEWQIFPGDLDVTLNWRPDTELKLVRIEDPASSHALIADDNSSVRVIPVGDKWPLNEVRQVLKDS